uniref:ETS domain-containing protein n=1 Tax=Strigamia maritima TaxID=126957 RepID=T1JMI9_STRMM
KALCLLLRSDFTERSPRAGDILYNVIQILLREASDNHPAYNGIRMYGYENGAGPDINLPEGMTSSWPVINADFHNLGHVIHQPRVQVSPSTSGVESTITLSPAPSTDSHSGGSPRLHRTSHNNKQKTHEQNGSVSDYEDSGTDSPVPSMVLDPVHAEAKKPIPMATESTPTPTIGEPITNGRLLWDFLHQLLNDPAQRYSSCIRWFNHESGIFKITDPNGLARLWGLQKNHLNMNFDKMSRALRYYYRVNILRKVQGERHCYQFLRQPTELKNCKQRALLNKLRMNDKPLDMTIHSNGLGGIKTEEQ